VWSWKRKVNSGASEFSEPKETLFATYSLPIHTFIHTRLLFSPFKNNAPMYQPQNLPFLAGRGSSSNLVRDVGPFTFHFAIAFGFTPSTTVAL
jgi:hypothetical protein